MDTKQKKRPPTRKPTTKTAAKSAATATKRRPAKKEEPKISADVVYLPPKPFNRSRLVLRLVTVVAVVLAIFFSLAVYFKVGDTPSSIEVIGEEKYTEAEVISASGMKAGDHLFFLGRTKVAGKIISALPYIKSVRIGIKLPDKVMIQIEEVDVTYAVKAQDENWWLMSAEGKIIEQAQTGKESRYTKILGLQLQNPTVGQQAVAWQDPAPTGNAPLTVTANDRLKAVINIAGFLEQNKVIGKVASMDVSSLMDIQLWYGNQYQILLGSTDQLGVKIATMKAAISQVDYDEGVLDIRDPNEILFREFT